MPSSFGVFVSVSPNIDEIKKLVIKWLLYSYVAIIRWQECISLVQRHWWKSTVFHIDWKSQGPLLSHFNTLLLSNESLSFYSCLSLLVMIWHLHREKCLYSLSYLSNERPLDGLKPIRIIDLIDLVKKSAWF